MRNSFHLIYFFIQKKLAVASKKKYSEIESFFYGVGLMRWFTLHETLVEFESNCRWNGKMIRFPKHQSIRFSVEMWQTNTDRTKTAGFVNRNLRRNYTNAITSLVDVSRNFFVCFKSMANWRCCAIGATFFKEFNFSSTLF